MDERHDIEKTLKTFRHDPGPGVRQSVLAEYERSIGGRTGFLRRPIPLYAAAAALVIMVGLSFFAGQRLAMFSGGKVAAPPLPTDGAAASAPNLEWSVAERDLL